MRSITRTSDNQKRGKHSKCTGAPPQPLGETWPCQSCGQRAHARLIADNVHFSASADGQVGWTDLVLHDIDTSDHRPRKQSVRHLGFHKEQVARNEVDKMSADDVNEESSSPCLTLGNFVARQEYVPDVFYVCEIF